VWHPIRRRFGIRAFGVNAYTSEDAGRQIVEEHDESSGHEELYVVLRGHATFTLDGEEVDAPAGTFVFLRDSSVVRGAVADDSDTLVLAVGAKPGEPFAISPWEAAFAAVPYTRTEQWDDAIAILSGALEERPVNPAAYYNLASVEARAGRRLDALTHLQEAVRRDPELAAYARSSSDFAALRREPGFPA
jgi:tetratricopeptide (TPR) repeat protein